MNSFVFENIKYKKVHAVDRYMAKGLDTIILVVIMLITTVIWYPVAAVVAIAYALFHDRFSNGSSPGKIIMGLKVIKIPNEEDPVTWKVSAIRNISFAIFTLFAVIPMMGWILMFLIGIPLLIFEAYLIYSLESGYRLGDILAGTRVVSIKELKEAKETTQENEEPEVAEDLFEPK